jgi:predicted DNA-binding transcriptional regulator YafY
LAGLGCIPLPGDEILNVMAKIRGLIPKEQICEVESKFKKITVDYTTWQGTEIPMPHIDEIRTALDGNRILTFQYYNRNGDDSTRKVEPHHLFLKDSNWYLQAYCTSKQDFRVFKLSRMSSPKVLDETFVPKEFSTENHNSPLLKWTAIKLLVDKSSKGWAADFCGIENIEPYSDDKVIVNFPFAENDYCYSQILRFGDKCECIEPESVRQEIVSRIHSMLKLYKNECS